MRLPSEFIDEMAAILPNELDAFLQSLEQEKARPGLRVNTLKISVEDFLALSPWPLESIPWVFEGFYYPEEARPAKHPYYHAGLFYLQEPSAMKPVAVLDPRPHDKVLDLCSAPGGKSLQIAARLNNTGLLVSNDLYPDRLKALTRNIEQAGIRNATVLNEMPKRLQSNFTGFFDKVLIDAPCSGEGMFRKDPRAIKSWEEYPPVFCQRRQRGILEDAAVLLNEGGTLVYSTCTFNQRENEEVIIDFLNNNQDFEGVSLEANHGIINGSREYTLRLWPHKLEGEGHFIAKIKRKGDNKSNDKAPLTKETRKLPELFSEFWLENIDFDLDRYDLEAYGDHLFLVSKELPILDGLKVSRPGWFVGELKKKRFEPSQALIMALKKEEVRNKLVLDQIDKNVKTYLRGQTFSIDSPNGWYGVFLGDFPLGWGKVSNKTLKNHYPKGWRMI